MKETWFEDWFNTPYYHQLYKGRDEKEAEQFIHKLIEHLSPKEDATMLDVACGKGRHALQLANKGFDVTGIDLSKASIAEAKKYEQSNLQFFEHDMRQPFWINYFDYAFNFFTSFGYFKTQRENDNAIRTISQTLNQSGVFVMDYMNVFYAEQHMEHQSEKEIEGNLFTITKWHDERSFYKKILIEDPNLPNPLCYNEIVSRFTLDDFKKMFEHQDLTIKEVFGDYKLNAFDKENSPRLIMICKKSSN